MNNFAFDVGNILLDILYQLLALIFELQLGDFSGLLKRMNGLFVSMKMLELHSHVVVCNLQGQPKVGRQAGLQVLLLQESCLFSGALPFRWSISA